MNTISILLESGTNGFRASVWVYLTVRLKALAVKMP